MDTAWWVPLLTFVGGAGVTLGVEYLRTINAREDRKQESVERRADRDAERTAKEQDRLQKLKDAHRSYQRDTLTELQEELSDFMRLTGEATHSDRQAWKAAGRPAQFPVSLLPPGISDEVNVMQRRIQILNQRVDDADLRSAIKGFVETAIAVVTASSLAQADQAERKLGTNFGPINEQIGTLLHTMPED